MALLALSHSAVSQAFSQQHRAEDRPAIKFLQRLVDIYIRGYQHVDVIAPCTIPQSGPAILVCNHISSLDPMLLQWACPRLIVWMMAREYYVPGSRWLFDIINIIPVERSKRDVTATRAAMRALDQGHVLGIFPEGRLAKDHSIGQFQTGVAMLALKSGVGVYPASLDGTMRDAGMLEAFFYTQRARLAFGQRVPLTPNDMSREAIERATTQIHGAVRQLHERVREGL